MLNREEEDGCAVPGPTENPSRELVERGVVEANELCEIKDGRYDERFKIYILI